MRLEHRFPALSDLRRACRRRIPAFVWHYLDSATGTEAGARRNRRALDRVLLRPAVLRGMLEPQLDQTLLGTVHALPFGIAPLGMSGFIWPGAEVTLARLAARERIPYCLSTVATRPPEDVGPHCGDMGWFQLYPPRDPEVRRDMLRRAAAAGFRRLAVTVDVPANARRERQLRAELSIPPRVTPRMLVQVAICPAWALGTLQHGQPRLRFVESYIRREGNRPATKEQRALLRGAPDWDTVAALRAEWPGPVALKGVTEPEVALRARALGVDAIWVSNHGARQFEGGPASITALSRIRAVVGPDCPLVFDSGVESGLDILRAYASGADFVMLGRAWHYALGALGARGAAHLVHILRADLLTNMAQIGITRVTEAPTRLDRD